MLRLDEIASNSALITSGGSPFTQAITTAQAIGDIRATLTDAVMNEVIMPLMNSKLGFRTDKDPNRPVWKKGKDGKWTNEAPEPYSVSTVRECVIEAILRGLTIVGNTFNIISQQSYTTKEGLWYLIGKKVEGLTDFKISIGVPKMIKPAGDARNASDEEAKGAIVACFAMWKLNGVADRVERDIPIRVNAQMGADAIMGKAERKILAAAYAQITGTTLGDADASEYDPAAAASEPRQTAGRDVTSTPAANPFAEEKETPAATAPLEVVTEVADEIPMDHPAKESPFVNENDERASLVSDIKAMLLEQDSDMATFGAACKVAGLVKGTKTLRDVPIADLRNIHDNRLAILSGEFGKEEAQ